MSVVSIRFSLSTASGMSNALGGIDRGCVEDAGAQITSRQAVCSSREALSFYQSLRFHKSSRGR